LKFGVPHFVVGHAFGRPLLNERQLVEYGMGNYNKQNSPTLWRVLFILYGNGSQNNCHFEKAPAQ
jgi:hypothetical protein